MPVGAPRAGVIAGGGEFIPESVVDDFESLSNGDPVDNITQWQDPNSAGVATNSRAFSGSISIDSTLDSAGNLAYYSDFGGATFNSPFTLEFKYNEETTNSGFGWVIRDGAGNDIAVVGSSNPEIRVIDANGTEQLITSLTPEYDTWRQILVTLNTDGTFDIEWRDLEGSTTSPQTFTGRPMINTAQNVGVVGLIDRPRGEVSLGSIVDCYIDDAERTV